MAKHSNNNETPPRRISRLVAGEQLFESKGFSCVKVTKNGEEELIELPIRSTGVSEFMEEVANRAPRPPVKRELIKADSDEGRQLGLQKDAFRDIFDTADEAYVNALEAHNRDWSWQVVIFALDIDWVNPDGSPAETFEDRRKILQNSGITLHQINKIIADVRNLTRIREDREDFLPAAWSA